MTVQAHTHLAFRSAASPQNQSTKVLLNIKPMNSPKRSKMVSQELNSKLIIKTIDNTSSIKINRVNSISTEELF
ncbi:hypothetical protein GCM10011339_01900 [Echinicola rosea]|uniref:Uncharacterized protein n=1 Tax=Echinicola rosea TaxID=1807691 RepID=A0ABQ1UFI0_9BACT|nr:hypothetical protein GCM10011339_01900 [Echinicola rosea]